MRLLFVSATPFEIAPLQDYLQQTYSLKEQGIFEKGPLQVEVLITGPGLTHTAFALGQQLAKKTYDLAINAGIAGSFRRDWPLGKVLHIYSEQFGDLGVEEADGRFSSIHELGLIAPNDAPFQQGVLINNTAQAFDFLPKAKGLTVNKVHGSHSSIQQLEGKFDVDIESMEGAAFFYGCLMVGISFVEIRSLSNYVEARNKENWNIPLAIEELNRVLIAMLQSLA
ncbi:MAG: futalosine hydrolase [Bacteroidota bacterium]